MTAPRNTALPSKEDLLKSVKAVVNRWADTPYYTVAENMAAAQWANLIDPFLGGTEVDYSRTVELACGHGRHSAQLLDRAEEFIGIDPLSENIDFCEDRFNGVPGARFIKNNGVDLADIETGSVTFLFCFDSMVHFDSDVVRAYLAEACRVLKPQGLFFTHHSNSTRNPAGDFERAIHARNFMTCDFMVHYALKEGLELVKSEPLDWGRGDNIVKGLDGLLLARKP